jgi:hypothetical protein
MKTLSAGKLLDLIKRRKTFYVFVNSYLNKLETKKSYLLGLTADSSIGLILNALSKKQPPK